MITTNLKDLENEIAEVANQFGVDIDLSLTSRLVGDEFFVTVIFDGKSYEYAYVLRYFDELERKRQTKRFVKLSAYRALSSSFKCDLPWGALTGIRPTRLAYQQGEGWQKFFTDLMRVSPSKTRLIEEILVEQQPYMVPAGSVDDLFVSIPFCPTRCAYCSFLSNEICKEKHVNEYIAALIEEIDHAKSLKKTYRCAYVGGGTPVALDDASFARVLEKMKGDYLEFTVEAGRPDCITESKLDIMRSCGVTRVCVNPQTFHDKTLALIGRKHTAKDVVEKYELVKRYGFIVNMDIIAGLPGESLEDFIFTVDKAVELSPDNVTVHTLCLKKGSKLKESAERLTVSDVSDMVDYARKTLGDGAYKPYYLYRQKYMAGNLENTGYSLKNAQCVYNIDIMEETANIVACGANGISKRVYGEEGRIERIAAPKDVATYLNKLNILLQEKNKYFA